MVLESPHFIRICSLVFSLSVTLMFFSSGSDEDKKLFARMLGDGELTVHVGPADGDFGHLVITSAHRGRASDELFEGRQVVV